MLDPGLLHLIKLLTKAAFRSIGNKIKTPAGALFALVMAGVIVGGLAPSLIMGLTDADFGSSPLFKFLASNAAFVLFCVTAIAVATDAGRSLLELRPPELQFVLAGPFSNSQILTYRMLNLLFNWCLMTLIFACVTMPYAGSFLGGLAAIFTGGMFVFLIAFIRTLLTPQLSSRAAGLIRVAGFGSIAVALIEFAARYSAAQQALPDAVVTISVLSELGSQTWSMQFLSFPFRSFGALLSAPMSVQLLGHLVVALLLCGAATAACYRWNSGFSELAVEGVARRNRKLQQMRGGRLPTGSTGNAEAAWSLPVFGWLGGAGPIAWNQLSVAVRRFKKLMIGLIVLAAAGTVAVILIGKSSPNWLSERQQLAAVPIALGAASYLGFLLTISTRLGFAAEPRSLVWYQVLPARPLMLGIGMLPGLMFSLVVPRLALFLPAVACTSMSWGQTFALLFAGLAVDVTFASLMNLIAGCTTMRPMPDGPPDLFQGARVFLFMAALGIAMLPIALWVTLITGAVLLIAGPSWTLGGITVALAMLAPLPLVWWYTGRTFVQRELAG